MRIRQKNFAAEKKGIFLSAIYLSLSKISTALINTPLQRGAGMPSVTRNRFNGFRALHKTVTGFTLIELILVMALLTVAVSVTAPALSNFFRGRALDSEAR